MNCILLTKSKVELKRFLNFLGNNQSLNLHFPHRYLLTSLSQYVSIFAPSMHLSAEARNILVFPTSISVHTRFAMTMLCNKVNLINATINMDETPASSSLWGDICALFTDTFCSRSTYCVTRQLYFRIKVGTLAVYRRTDVSDKSAFSCPRAHLQQCTQLAFVSRILLGPRKPPCKRISFDASESKLVSLPQGILWKMKLLFFFFFSNVV